MSDDMSELVRVGYDRVAEHYAATRDQFKSLPYLRRFAALLPARARVLDLGCGTGVPAARYLVDQGFSLTDIDISSRMLELARANVPEARFELRDMLSLRPEEYEVDGIVALYSLFHVRREEHPRLLGVLRSFLGDEGTILLTMGAEEWEGTEAGFHGAEMFWSHFGPERNREMLRTAGFRIEADEIDASGGERHQVVLARTASRGPD